MALAIAAMPGLWCDDYVCKEDNIVETINHMLSLHKEDFPVTACVGFTITKSGSGLVHIWPKVIRSDLTVYDSYTKEIL